LALKAIFFGLLFDAKLIPWDFASGRSALRPTGRLRRSHAKSACVGQQKKSDSAAGRTSKRPLRPTGTPFGRKRPVGGIATVEDDRDWMTSLWLLKSASSLRRDDEIEERGRKDIAHKVRSHRKTAA